MMARRAGRRLAAVAVAMVSAVLGAEGCNSFPTVFGTLADDLPNSLCDGVGLRPDAGDGARTVMPHVVVHTLRGAFDVSSRGMDSLARDLSRLGIEAYSHSDSEWQRVADRIASAYLGSREPKQIVMVGHSFGGDCIIRIAEVLRLRGIPVALLFPVDATIPPPVPDNVAKCVHFYIPWPIFEVAPWILPGQPVVAAEGNTFTRLENDDLTRSAWCVTHLGVDASRHVHQRILDEILALP